VTQTARYKDGHEYAPNFFGGVFGGEKWQKLLWLRFTFALRETQMQFKATATATACPSTQKNHPLPFSHQQSSYFSF
jgi:hypothetical protein